MHQLVTMYVLPPVIMSNCPSEILIESCIEWDYTTKATRAPRIHNPARMSAFKLV